MMKNGASNLRVNLTVDRRFDRGFLYRLVFLAMRSGGLLDKCNGETARFAFPLGSVAEFMEELGCRAPVRKTSVSSWEGGGSWVDVRFQARGDEEDGRYGNTKVTVAGA